MQFAPGNPRIILRTVSGSQRIRQSGRGLFGRISFFPRGGGLQARFAHGNPGIISASASSDGFFGLRPLASMTHSCELVEGSGVAGTPGVRLPGVLPPELGAYACSGQDNSSITVDITSEPQPHITTTHNHTEPHGTAHNHNHNHTHQPQTPTTTTATTTSTTTTTTTGSDRFVLLFFGTQLVERGGRYDAAWRPRLRVAEETATPALMVET